MSTPFIEMPQRADASPRIDEQAAARRSRPPTGSRCPRRSTVPDMMFSATPTPAVAVHADRRAACSCRRSSSRRGPSISTSTGGVEADGERVRAARVDDAPARRLRVGAPASACRRALSSRTRRGREVERSRPRRRSRSPCRRAPAPSCRPAPGSGSQTTASAAPGSTAIARYSEAIATQSSVSAITAGLHAIGSRSTAKPSARADGERVEAVEVVEAALERLLERRALAQPPGQVAGRDLGVVVGLELDALAAQLAAQAVVVARATRCGRGRGRGRSRTGASARS